MFEVYDVVLIPLVMGVVEVFKRAGVNKRFLPIIALALGIIVGVVYLTGFEWKQRLLVGAMIGLSASGLYSSSKNTFQKNEDE